MKTPSAEPGLQEPAPTLTHTPPAEQPLITCRSFVQWTARIFSLPVILTFSIGMIHAVFSGRHLDKSDVIGALCITFFLLIAWRWELLGGGLMFLGTSLSACITRMHEEPWSFYIGWMLAFLFLTSGSIRIAVSPTEGRRAIKAGRIMALIFALLVLATLGGCFGFGAASKFNG